MHGGYGYTREYDVEQHYRDNRLNPIHEGTHGIQGLDLLGRKVMAEAGAGLNLLLADDRATDRAGRRELGGEAALLGAATGRCRRRVAETTARLWSTGDPETALANSLRSTSKPSDMSSLAWIWLEQFLAAGANTGELLRREAPGRALLLPVRAAHAPGRSSTCSRASTAPPSRWRTTGSRNVG